MLSNRARASRCICVCLSSLHTVDFSDRQGTEWQNQIQSQRFNIWSQDLSGRSRGVLEKQIALVLLYEAGHYKPKQVTKAASRLGS